ncbi:Plant methyltransferase dimerization [Penicillium daleae]|uniref:Plant methyltransferase dimerization n=1 Tax=Penicillium daleae TaxID=63821 RepID=A0AAD6G2J7_9EURO|nr:Plant methyltransferase dimerization [Penicillium daleae]KAJ5449923.1 Plant methyltransferase dimerization [Penicillium daleae]
MSPHILDHADLGADTPLLVDIEAGRGHELIGFRKRFSDALGRLILDDLPMFIKEIQGAQDLTAAGVDIVPCDFFKQVQQVHGEFPLPR